MTGAAPDASFAPSRQRMRLNLIGKRLPVYAKVPGSGQAEQKRESDMIMRVLMFGVVGAIASVIGAILPAQAGMIGPGKLRMTEAAPLTEPIRRCRTGRRIHDCDTTPEENRRRREESERKKREAAKAGRPISDRRCRTGRRIHDCAVTPGERPRREASRTPRAPEARKVPREARRIDDGGGRRATAAFRRGSSFRDGPRIGGGSRSGGFGGRRR
jgi:hypothetical protein